MGVQQGTDNVVRIPIPAPTRAIYDMGDQDGNGHADLLLVEDGMFLFAARERAPSRWMSGGGST